MTSNIAATTTKMKVAKMRVELKTISTADVNACAMLLWRWRVGNKLSDFLNHVMHLRPVATSLTISALMDICFSHCTGWHKKKRSSPKIE